MNRIRLFLFLGLALCLATARAQQAGKSELQQRAEAATDNIASARYLFIRAFEDYTAKGQISEGVNCAVKAASLYHKENFYKEAFDLLRRVDDNINATSQSNSSKAALHYQVTKERMQMYMKLRKSPSILDQLNIMERLANTSGDENLKNDLLYNKAVYYYTFGQNAQGNAVFREMAGKLTANKEYDKVDKVYQTLIANGRKSGSANLVAQSYSSYIAWKDSINELKRADEIGTLKQQITDLQTSIDEKDDTLATRRLTIAALCTLAVILAAALIVAIIILLRFILVVKQQKNTIRTVNENNALKAKFISNISAQLTPTLQKLNTSTPEVKALLSFTDHIQTLSALECQTDGAVETEDTPILSFCEDLMEQLRKQILPSAASLTVNAPKMNAKLNREYLTHILLHLLHNAALHTPQGGSITLEYKKRGAHKHQFLVTNTGPTIPPEQQEDLFRPFLQIRDLTTGDGLGLPICKLMAIKMNGDLHIDPTFTKGVRFVLDLHA